VKPTDKTTGIAGKVIPALLVALLFALFIPSLFGEKIPFNDGAGFDGAFYREVFRNFTTDFFTVGYDSFRIQRIFPFCLMNVVYNIAGIPLDNFHMMRGMQALHLLNILLQVVFFYKLAGLLRWKRSTTATLFALFFFNYYTLKNCGYEPFQTDGFAVTIALISYYAFLKGKRGISLAVSLLGLITWPTLTYVMLLLHVFPQKEGLPGPAPSGTYGRLASNAFKILPFAYAGLAMALVLFSFALHKQANLEGLLLITPSPLRIGINLAAIVFALWFIAATRVKGIGIPYSPAAFRKSFSLKPALVMVACICAVSAFLRLHTNEEFFFDGKLFLFQIIARPLKYPLITFVGHIVYWGALPALLIIFARDFTRNITEASPGHALALLAFLFLALDSEARHVATFMPLLLPALGHALDSADLKPKFAIYIIVLQLLLSHFYMPINVDGFAEALENGKFSTPEAQRYFMNYGPWMNGSHYHMWITTALATLLGVNEVFKASMRVQSPK